jgi:hypothetical protein
MTHKIDIYSDVARTAKCIDWCNKNLNNNEWDLKLLSMAPLHYAFEFKDPQIHLMAVMAH